MSNNTNRLLVEMDKSVTLWASYGRLLSICKCADTNCLIRLTRGQGTLLKSVAVFEAIRLKLKRH